MVIRGIHFTLIQFDIYIANCIDKEEGLVYQVPSFDGFVQFLSVFKEV